MDTNTSVNVEELPTILLQEEETELHLILQHIQAGDSQEYMLAKYMITRVLIHEKADQLFH